MTRYFEVELRWIAVVEAENEMEAISAAEYDKRDICGDSDPEVEAVGEIKGLDQLPQGWDAHALPYGGDGETRLSELLPQTEPVRDTNTLDMFEVQS